MLYDESVSKTNLTNCRNVDYHSWTWMYFFFLWLMTDDTYMHGLQMKAFMFEKNSLKNLTEKYISDTDQLENWFINDYVDIYSYNRNMSMLCENDTEVKKKCM